MEKKLVIGLDFGTDSVRALIVDAFSGEAVSSASSKYARWQDGLFCDSAALQFRQHPQDYIDAMTACIKSAIAGSPPGAATMVAAIGVGTTGSTPCAVCEDATPLALKSEFFHNSDAMFFLWKDHSSKKEADAINNALSEEKAFDYGKYIGRKYSEEWFWAKALHILRGPTEVKKHTWTFIELSDWIPSLLTGVKHCDALIRNRCAAGHKGMWNAEWSGYPATEFWQKLDPMLAVIRSKMHEETITSDCPAGVISFEWAEKLGLEGDVVVAVGGIDAHIGAVGAGIKEGTLVRIMGTSACDIMVASKSILDKVGVLEINGQVDGSVLPDMVGLEAGQASFGDTFAWYAGLLAWGKQELDKYFFDSISEAAAKEPVDANGPIFIDWLNGRRSPKADLAMKGAFTGLTLGTTAPRLYRSMAEGLAFGFRRIVETIADHGVDINRIIATGSVAKRSPFIMQITSDVLDIPIQVAASEQTCALGAAMFASVAAGLHKSISEAQDAMGQGNEWEYIPNKCSAKQYQGIFKKYLSIAKEIGSM